MITLKIVISVPVWLSWLNLELLILAQVMIEPRVGLCTECGTCLGFSFSPSLSALPFPHHLFQKNKNKNKNSHLTILGVWHVRELNPYIL